MKKLSRSTSLTDQAVELFREAITSGELVAGETYSANSLGERIGVSRTPAREALLQLARAGMIRIDKNKGATILATTLTDLVEVFQIRMMLEVPAAARVARTVSEAGLSRILECFADMQAAADVDDAQATLRADRDFHLQIMENAGNKKLVDVLENLRNLVLTRGVGTAPAARSCQDVVDDHLDIVEAISAHDGPAAAAAMRRHILNTAELLIAQEAGDNQEFDAAAVTEALRWPNVYS
ncbi:GntR family transcriptional regulator [Arthrobacter globiformis]|uniref:GntR family transcriptional regulator n=1 Tax=Arthrobacter globiformis TaxID=1665 RepID=A0A328HGG9_ARTGO|nr:GntR family transcriptional regulator [Arthrobacter globiformis]RAM36535.1 GntR family transcriptional regulator [Arthrobacter globiformis]